MTFLAVEASKTAKNVKVLPPGWVKNIGNIKITKNGRTKNAINNQESNHH